MLDRWPTAYADRILRTAKPGWELPGVAKRPRPTKRPVDEAHDVAMAKLVDAGKVTGTYLMWPQAALQPWMVRPRSNVARGTADLALPRVCRSLLRMRESYAAAK